mmetsp:Transcript_9609/g.12920  ORF Transcript_9609/g.12920 Transcript_9609/m.12920 type:complete len:101 (+) Transcript_9609:565-867(+)
MVSSHCSWYNDDLSNESGHSLLWHLAKLVGIVVIVVISVIPGLVVMPFVEVVSLMWWSFHRLRFYSHFIAHLSSWAINEACCSNLHSKISQVGYKEDFQV